MPTMAPTPANCQNTDLFRISFFLAKNININKLILTTINLHQTNDTES